MGLEILRNSKEMKFPVIVFKTNKADGISTTTKSSNLLSTLSSTSLSTSLSTTSSTSSSTKSSNITEIVKGSLARIDVKTINCTGCSSGDEEQGLQLHLVGPGFVECTTGNLDNEGIHDYDFYHVSQFKSTIFGGSDPKVLGECNNVSLALLT